MDLWKQNKKFDGIRCKKKQKMALFSYARKTKGNRCHFASFCFEAKIFFKAKTAHPSAYLVIMLPIGGES